MNRAYVSIRRIGDQHGGEEVTTEVNAGGVRSGKKRRRHWVRTEYPGPPRGDVSIDEKTVVGELTMLTPDIRKSKESEIRSTEWVASEASNCKSAIPKIMGIVAVDVVKGDTTPYRAEYLGERKEAAAGICLQDPSSIYDGDGRRSLSGTGLLRTEKRIHEYDIYICI